MSPILRCISQIFRSICTAMYLQHTHRKQLSRHWFTRNAWRVNKLLQCIVLYSLLSSPESSSRSWLQRPIRKWAELSSTSVYGQFASQWLSLMKADAGRCVEGPSMESTQIHLILSKSIIHYNIKQARVSKYERVTHSRLLRVHQEVPLDRQNLNLHVNTDSEADALTTTPPRHTDRSKHSQSLQLDTIIDIYIINYVLCVHQWALLFRINIVESYHAIVERYLNGNEMYIQLNKTDWMKCLLCINVSLTLL